MKYPWREFYRLGTAWNSTAIALEYNSRIKVEEDFCRSITLEYNSRGGLLGAINESGCERSHLTGVLCSRWISSHLVLSSHLVHWVNYSCGTRMTQNAKFLADHSFWPKISIPLRISEAPYKWYIVGIAIYMQMCKNHQPAFQSALDALQSANDVVKVQVAQTNTGKSEL